MKFIKASGLAAVIVATVVAVGGPAVAQDGPGNGRGSGGVLTGIGNSTADDSANACRSFLQVLTPMECEVPQGGHQPARHTGASGGVFTNDANMHASRGSNACGSSVAVLAPTSCVVRAK
ncbi:hypothetical protein [Streptomyces sp. URMC 123]|uniref:hypothetical protein n=1 Tax=Streptomyces sp. URMC 123 TaxID=3423403 RepID=UPI003F1D491B